MYYPNTVRFPETFEVCERCNYDNHMCPFCGTNLTHAEAVKFKGLCEGDYEYYSKENPSFAQAHSYD